MTRTAAAPTLNGTGPTVFDLDEALGQVDIGPRPVKIGGKVYQVRRDLLGTEIATYNRLVQAGGRDLEALTILVGADEAVTLLATLEELQLPRFKAAVQKIQEIAGFGTPGGAPGESPAS